MCSNFNSENAKQLDKEEKNACVAQGQVCIEAFQKLHFYSLISFILHCEIPSNRQIVMDIDQIIDETRYDLNLNTEIHIKKNVMRNKQSLLFFFLFFVLIFYFIIIIVVV